jgi:hypothetical protein
MQDITMFTCSRQALSSAETIDTIENHRPIDTIETIFPSENRSPSTPTIHHN